MELVWIARGQIRREDHDVDDLAQLTLQVAADFQERTYLYHFLQYGWKGEPPDHGTLVNLERFIMAGARQVEDMLRIQNAAEQTHRRAATAFRGVTMTLALSVALGVEFAQIAFNGMLVSGLISVILLIGLRSHLLASNYLLKQKSALELLAGAVERRKARLDRTAEP